MITLNAWLVYGLGLLLYYLQTLTLPSAGHLASVAVALGLIGYPLLGVTACAI
jgi:hypothetical protein